MKLGFLSLIIVKCRLSTYPSEAGLANKHSTSSDSSVGEMRLAGYDNKFPDQFRQGRVFFFPENASIGDTNPINPAIAE